MSVFLLHTVIEVQFDPSSYSVLEGGVANLRVVLNGSSDNEVTVAIQTFDGTATGKGSK